MTPNQLTLLRKVAKRMPEVFIENNQLAPLWRDTWAVVTSRELLQVAAEFENVLSESDQVLYYRELKRQCCPDKCRTNLCTHTISATPEQRFTARLKMWGEM